MRLSGDAIHYLLSLDFDDVTFDAGLRRVWADYPMLYDVSADMSGHAVLVPDHERPVGGSAMQGVICVCTGEESARAAREAGLAVALVRDAVTFPRLYNSMLANYVRNERMDARLHAYVTTYAGFQPLLDSCAEAMGVMVALIDAQYRLVAYADGERASNSQRASSFSGEIEEDALDLFMASGEYRRLRGKRAVFAIPGSHDLFVKNVFHEGNLVGMLVMRHGGDALKARFVSFLLGYLAPFVEQMYANRGSFTRDLEEADRMRDALAAIVGGDLTSCENVDALLVQHGHEPSARYCVMLIDRSFSQEGAEGLHYLARRIDLTWTKSYAAVIGQELLVLAYMGASSADHAHALRTDLPELLRDIMAKAGVSRLFSGMRNLPAAGTQARIALQQGKEQDPMSWFYRFDDYALDWFVAHGLSGYPAEHVVHPAVVALAQRDAEEGTEYLPTLSMFMECRYNASLAAERLFVARSTLLNRLARIQDMTGVNLDDLRERTYLSLSLALLR